MRCYLDAGDAETYRADYNGSSTSTGTAADV